LGDDVCRQPITLLFFRANKFASPSLFEQKFPTRDSFAGTGNLKVARGFPRKLAEQNGGQIQVVVPK
jgi:hypothetical protein